MRYRVTQRQFNILIDNFNMITPKGLELKMTGRTAREVIDEHSNEGKSYIVNFSLNGYRSKIKVFSTNNSRARKLASELMPQAKIFNAYEVR
ncbi:hypothetical protein ACFQ5N_06410 [Lutibacter holmesii]|uniref:Uncharacterized protein n=1 Tax=Lutibacter holmesii TaxID=1137985 RepID=A0ABW3WMK8_9FLAO